MNPLLDQAKGKAAVCALAAVVLLAYLYGSLLLDQGKAPAGAPVQHFDAGAIPLGEAQDVELDRADGTVRVTGPNPYLLLPPEPRPPHEAIAHLKLRLRPLGPFDCNGFRVEYIPVNSSMTEFNGTINRGRGVPVSEGEDVTVFWNLLRPGVQCCIRLPPGAAFRLESAEVAGAGPADPADPVSLFTSVGKPLLVGALVWLILAAVQLGWRPFLADARLVKNVLLVGLALASAAVLFLLPPFQGPDEWTHWRAALGRFRPGATAEAPLYNLHVLMAARELRFRPETQLPAERLRANAADLTPDARTRPVSYAGPITYPFVALVALVFPRVETTAEALTFYYLCRLLPAVALFVLLFVANRRHQLPYTALFFFSTPLVMQQVTIITSDTVPLLGTVLAGLLFLELQRRRTWWLIAFLWFVCLAVTAAKPPAYAGILLLPLLLVPLRKVPGKAVLLPTAALLVLAAGGVAAKTGLDLLREGPRPEELDAQLRFLCTGQGVATFLSAFLKLFTAEPWLTRWFQPLGWVDTELNDRHLALLLLSLGLAALFDLFARGPALAAAVRRRPAWAAVLAAVLVAHFLFAALSSALIMYVAETAPGAALIRGFQLRYLFPVIIPFFFVPLALLEGKKAEAGQEAAPAGPGTPLLNSAALCLLPLLLFARQVELTADLLIRYW